MHKSLLKHFIQEETQKYLDEKAKTIPETENLCLFISKSSGTSLKFILYDGNKLKEYYEQNIDSPSGIIYGFLSIVQNPCGFYMVNLSGAKKSYGPLMYDLAMSFIHPNYLASDRKSVSYSAQKVWNYMFNQRNNDFDIVPIINRNCQFHTYSEEYEALNHKYRIKNKLDISFLIENAKQNIEEVSEEFSADTISVRTTLVKLSDKFFLSFEI